MEPSTLVALFGGTALAALAALVLVLSRKGRTEDEARAYLAGFTYVLSDDPDAAIVELSKAAQLNRQTLETYFALGALFRRKGDLERAIRLHSNILLRPGLGSDLKRRAQLALALDYRRAGLRGRAAETLEKVLEDEPRNVTALVRYRQVLEDGKDWARAIEVQSRILELEPGGETVLSHLLAEQARTSLPDHPGEALALAERAVARVPSCADAQLALGEARLAAGEASAAAGPLCRALELEPELSPRAVALLGAALEGPAAVERFLAERIAARPEQGAPFEFALALTMQAQGRVDRAIERLRRLVERRPRMWEARKQLGALLLASDRSEEVRADYQEILGTLGQPALGFICQRCRQKLPELLFRCPSCEEWDTVCREPSAPPKFDPVGSRV